VGDALAFAIGAKVAFDGIVLMIGSIVAGGAGTVMSGGTLVIAGVAVSVKGVVLGGAMTAAGGAIASRAVFAMKNDFAKFSQYNQGKSLEPEKLAAKVPGKFKKNGQCVGFAENFKKALDKAKIKYEIIRVDSPAGIFIYSARHNLNLGSANRSIPSFHYGIKVNNIVYDNIFHSGVAFDLWKTDIGIVQGSRITYKIAKTIVNS